MVAAFFVAQMLIPVSDSAAVSSQVLCFKGAHVENIMTFKGRAVSHSDYSLDAVFFLTAIKHFSPFELHFMKS